MASRGKLYIVTGIPGTGVEEALIRFAEYARTSGRDVATVKIEEEVVNIAEDAIETGLGSGLPANIINVVRLPRESQYALWREGFERAIEIAEADLTKGIDVVLTFHASWYLQESRQLISAVDWSAIGELEVAAVINLIDGVCDVAARNTGSTRLFDAPDDVPEEDALVHWGRCVMDLLHWRSVETAFSQTVANVAGCNRFFLFAVKHPARTLYDLLYSDKPVLYLSHPISAFRAIWNRHSTEEEDKQVEELSQDIGTLTQELRNSFTVFEPTTIDELRYVETQMGRRWPIGSLSNTVWSSPESETLKQWEAFPHDVGGAEAQSVVDGISEEIARQIDSRDHQLVDQSDTMAFYRPYISGSMSKGMRAEMWQFTRLHRLELQSLPAFGHHPPEDEPERLRGCAAQAIENVIRNLGEEEISALRKVLDGQDVSAWPSSVDELQEAFREVIDACSISYGSDARQSRNPLGRGSAAQSQDVLRDIACSFKVLAEDPEVSLWEEEGTLVLNSESRSANQVAEWIVERHGAVQRENTEGECTNGSQ